MTAVTTQTLTLTGFLLARLAEDEANAADCGCVLGGDVPDALVDRNLADVEAKRRIVERAATYNAEVVPLAEDVLLDLAAVYSNHADYRDGWRP